MDNLCHTLTGAALAETGLKGRTRFGSAALMIAANLPDLDVLAFASSTPAVALRRGWTHGPLAQLLLPVLLTAGFVLLDRWRPPQAPSSGRVRAPAMLLLGYAGVLLHVAMDWLNTYGVRLLMPFSGRWFYGDAVFIVDPWLWLILGAGFLLSRRRRAATPARLAIGLAALYILLMTLSAFAARQRVADAWREAHGSFPEALMVGPVPVNPWRKTVIVDAGSYYVRGTFRWWPATLELAPDRIPKNAELPAARRASEEDPDFRGFLVWARFPYYEVSGTPAGSRVVLRDVRFRERGLFAVETVVP